MKNLYFLAFVLAFPLTLLAQTIHGLWTGTLVNDSTHRVQNFELGLSEYRGKITGYTYTTFIENDTFYYSVKRIKAERRDGKLVVEDVEMVGNNFPERAAKHVKQVTTFPLINDSTIDITKGRWTTNQTKRYYSLGGSASVKEQEEEKESDLLSHLQEMKVKSDIAVKQKPKKNDNFIVRNSAPIQPNNENKTPSKKGSEISKTSQTTSAALTPNKEELSSEKQTEVAKSSTKSSTSIDQSMDVRTASEVSDDKKFETRSSTTQEKIKETVPNSNAQTDDTRPIHSTKQEVANNTKTNISQGVPIKATNNSVAATTSTVQPKISNQKQVITETVSQKPNESVSANNKPTNEKIATVSINAPTTQRKESLEKIKELPAEVAERKNESIQADIFFKNDSLVLSLYDNGIVDGDTVSVFVNGENIISKQKLKEAAAKKTIYISPGTDSIQLVLFADNLGTIPPNTGLLTVRDGDEVYQVRFSADLQKNASLFLRRKKQ